MAETPTRRKHFLKEWRKSRGYTLEEVSERIEEMGRERADDRKMSAANLSMIERNRTDYTKKTLEWLAEVYGCTPADLLSRHPDEAEDELMTVVRDLTPEQRGQLAKIGKTFLN